MIKLHLSHRPSGWDLYEGGMTPSVRQGVTECSCGEAVFFNSPGIVGLNRATVRNFSSQRNPVNNQQHIVWERLLVQIDLVSRQQDDARTPRSSLNLHNLCSAAKDGPVVAWLAKMDVSNSGKAVCLQPLSRNSHSSLVYGSSLRRRQSIALTSPRLAVGIDKPIYLCRGVQNITRESARLPTVHGSIVQNLKKLQCIGEVRDQNSLIRNLSHCVGLGKGGGALVCLRELSITSERNAFCEPSFRRRRPNLTPRPIHQGKCFRRWSRMERHSVPGCGSVTNAQRHRLTVWPEEVHRIPSILRVWRLVLGEDSDPRNKGLAPSSVSASHIELVCEVSEIWRQLVLSRSNPSRDALTHNDPARRHRVRVLRRILELELQHLTQHLAHQLVPLSLGEEIRHRKGLMNCAEAVA